MSTCEISPNRASYHHTLLVDASHKIPELVALNRALGAVSAVMDASGPLRRGVERLVIFPLALVSAPMGRSERGE